MIKLNGNHYAICPAHNRPTSFFAGEDGAFMSEERYFLTDTLVDLKCLTHVFPVKAGDLVEEQPGRAA